MMRVRRCSIMHIAVSDPATLTTASGCDAPSLARKGVFHVKHLFEALPKKEAAPEGANAKGGALC